LFMHCGRFHEYECCINLLHSILEPPMAHGHLEDDHLWGECLTERRYDLVRFVFCKLKVGRTKGPNAEHAPDVGKCKDEQSLLYHCDNYTNPKNQKWHGRLDEHCSKTGIYLGYP